MVQGKTFNRQITRHFDKYLVNYNVDSKASHCFMQRRESKKESKMLVFVHVSMCEHKVLSRLNDEVARLRAIQKLVHWSHLDYYTWRLGILHVIKLFIFWNAIVVYSTALIWFLYTLSISYMLYNILNTQKHSTLDCRLFVWAGKQCAMRFIESAFVITFR